jgi:hypothetical protein
MVDEYETPLHELCALAKGLELHIDMAIYADGGGYEGGARITAVSNPMDSIRDGVCVLRGRVETE